MNQNFYFCFYFYKTSKKDNYNIKIQYNIRVGNIIYRQIFAFVCTISEIFICLPKIID